jgi:hypothetical protein
MFSSLNEKRSAHAYIYIGDESFTGFNNDNIRQLKEAGIETISLVYGNPDGSYREVTSPLTYDQLPIVSSSDPSSSSTSSSSSDTAAGIVFAVIIIIIVVLLLIILFRNYSPR